MRSFVLVMVVLISQLASAVPNKVPVSKLLDQMIHRSTLPNPEPSLFTSGLPLPIKTTLNLNPPERLRNIG